MEENNNTENVQNESKKPTNGLAIAGFVVSLCSLIINFGGIVGLVGTILSAVGLAKAPSIKNSGKGLAIAGLIIGILSIIYGIYSIIKAATILSTIF